MVTSVLHDGLARYLADQKSTQVPASQDGAFNLIFDNQYRVTCLPFLRGDLLLEARIVHLPADVYRRRTIIEMLLEQAGNRLDSHPERIVLSPGGQMLALQQVVPAQADRAQFGSMLDSFVNALAGWRRLAGVL